MTNCQFNGEKRVLVAVDIAKFEHVILIEDPDGEVQKLKIRNVLEDFLDLSNRLKAFKAEVIVGMEPTCSFHRNLCYFLMKEGFVVRGISSLVMARTREALHNSWDKNDLKDANVILYLLKQNMTQTMTEPSLAGFNHLQELSKTYEQIVRRKTKIQHSIANHYLPIYFPEAHVFFRGSRVRWFSRVFKVFPTPSLVKQYSFEEFCKLASPIIGKVQFKHSLLKDFYDLATKSVGLPAGIDSFEVKMFRYTVEEHERLNMQLSHLEEQIEVLLSEDADYLRLKSIPGIGPLIALTIVAEAGNIRRFGHERQFLKYCGLNLSTQQSGVTRGQSHISKRGNPRLRCAFWQAARAALNTKSNNSIKEKFNRYTISDPQNKDLKRKARTAVAIKLARIVFGLIKNNDHYRSDFERTNPSGRTRGVLDVEAAVQ